MGGCAKMSLSSHDGREDDKEYHDKRAEIRRHLPELEGRLQEMRKYKRSISALLNLVNRLHKCLLFQRGLLTFPPTGSNGEEGSPVFCALSELRRQVLFPSTATRVPLHVLLRGEDLLRREVPSLKSKDATSECILLRSWRNRYKKLRFLQIASSTSFGGAAASAAWWRRSYRTLLLLLLLLLRLPRLPNLLPLLLLPRPPTPPGWSGPSSCAPAPRRSTWRRRRGSS